MRSPSHRGLVIDSIQGLRISWEHREREIGGYLSNFIIEHLSLSVGDMLLIHDVSHMDEAEFEELVFTGDSRLYDNLLQPLRRRFHFNDIKYELFKFSYIYEVIPSMFKEDILKTRTNYEMSDTYGFSELRGILTGNMQEHHEEFPEKSLTSQNAEQSRLDRLMLTHNKLTDMLLDVDLDFHTSQLLMKQYIEVVAELSAL